MGYRRHRSTGELLPPHRYIEIPNIEDGLFVSEEQVPLFVELGWRKGRPLANFPMECRR
jgi:hypothetical protein